METIFNSRTLISDNAAVTSYKMNRKIIMQCLDNVVTPLSHSVSPVAKSLLIVMCPFCNIQTYQIVFFRQLPCCCCQCSLWNRLY